MEQEKLNRMINLLEICPECVSGYVKSPGFKTTKLSGNASYPPSYIDVYDTTTKSQIVKCTNEKCTHSITFENPYYLNKTKSTDEKPKVLENEYELFG
jgi:hypothetical protein